MKFIFLARECRRAQVADWRFLIDGRVSLESVDFGWVARRDRTGYYRWSRAGNEVSERLVARCAGWEANERLHGPAECIANRKGGVAWNVNDRYLGGLDFLAG